MEALLSDKAHWKKWFLIIFANSLAKTARKTFKINVYYDIIIKIFWEFVLWW